MGGTTEGRRVLEAEADGLALLAYDDDFLVITGQRFDADQLAGLGVDDGRADADTAASVGRKLADFGTLTVAVLTNHEDAAALGDDVHADDVVIRAQTNTADTATDATHRAGVLLVEADGLAE